MTMTTASDVSSDRETILIDLLHSAQSRNERLLCENRKLRVRIAELQANETREVREAKNEVLEQAITIRDLIMPPAGAENLIAAVNDLDTATEKAFEIERRKAAERCEVVSLVGAVDPQVQALAAGYAMLDKAMRGGSDDHGD
jgi:hypothetical protein